VIRCDAVREYLYRERSQRLALFFEIYSPARAEYREYHYSHHAFLIFAFPIPEQLRYVPDGHPVDLQLVAAVPLLCIPLMATESLALLELQRRGPERDGLLVYLGR
jgi:hypothetical protein